MIYCGIHVPKHTRLLFLFAGPSGATGRHPTFLGERIACFEAIASPAIRSPARCAIYSRGTVGVTCRRHCAGRPSASAPPVILGLGFMAMSACAFATETLLPRT